MKAMASKCAHLAVGGRHFTEPSFPRAVSTPQRNEFTELRVALKSVSTTCAMPPVPSSNATANAIAPCGTRARIFEFFDASPEPAVTSMGVHE